jgi:hypothetical protein
MLESTPMISEEEMRDALLRSGYLLEQRVAHVLDQRGYYVDTNAAYPDDVTGKSREFDIDALTMVDLGAYDFLFVNVLCSCVNNPQPLAFIIQDAQVPFMHHEFVKMSGLPIQVRSSPESDLMPLAEALHFERFHHYNQRRLSTQYCSFAKKRGSTRSEWVATHIDEHHDALNAIGPVIEACISQHYKGWTLSDAEVINIEIYYPVLILQGDPLEVAAQGSDLRITDTNHVLYRLAEFSAHRQAEYFVDVIRESYLPSYLEMLDGEMQRMGRAIRRRKRAMRDSIAVLVDRARETGNIRAAFEEED